MKIIPTIYRSSFKENKTLFMHHMEYLPRCCGTYISKGSFKAFCKSDDYYEEFIFKEKTVMIPGFYKPHGVKYFIPLNERHYVESCKSGWNLTALEDDSSLNCIFYPLGDKPRNELVKYTVVPGTNDKTWDHTLIRVPSETTLMLSDAYTIDTQTQIFFPKDYYLVVVSGRININGVDKLKKSWTISSKDQLIDIENTSNKQSLIFLLR